jgi:hypothetical protein
VGKREGTAGKHKTAGCCKRIAQPLLFIYTYVLRTPEHNVFFRVDELLASCFPWDKASSEGSFCFWEGSCTGYVRSKEYRPHASRKLKLGELRGEIGHPPLSCFHRSRSSTWLGSPFWPSVDCVKR